MGASGKYVSKALNVGSDTPKAMFFWGAFIGGGVNAGYTLKKGEEPNPVDVYIAAITGGLTNGRGLPYSVAVNTSGSFIGSSIKGENPTSGVIGTAAGSVAGYGVGKVTLGPSILKATTGSGTQEFVGDMVKGALPSSSSEGK